MYLPLNDTPTILKNLIIPELSEIKGNISKILEEKLNPL